MRSTAASCCVSDSGSSLRGGLWLENGSSAGFPPGEPRCCVCAYVMPVTYASPVVEAGALVMVSALCGGVGVRCSC